MWVVLTVKISVHHVNMDGVSIIKARVWVDEYID